MGMELLKALAGIDLVHVPYKGTGPAITDLLGGQVQLMFNSMPSVLPLVKSGKLKGLGVGSPQRSPAIPELPTVAEAGVPGFENVTWYGMFAPAKTPRDIVIKLNQQVVKILADPEMAQRLASQGAEPRSSTPEELAKFMQVESVRWKKVIQVAGIKLE
jgi:tripartite-type tricarboxylate transporter receptor subunit TctC